jgi:signal transduction histidine kinase
MQQTIAPRDVLSRALHPPLRDPAFWAVQAAVATLAGLHFYLDSSDRLESTVLPTGMPVTLLLIPVLYASLRDGLAGSAATALLATLLWLPDLVLPDARGHPAGDAIDLLIVDGAAVFAGVHVERGRIQRRRAEAAERERRDADMRYRDLFVAVRAYAARLVDAHEEERQRIARDIHDDPLQRLVDVARRMDASQPPATRAALLDVVNRLRDITRGLRPPGLDQLGLPAAVRGMLADVEDGGAVAMHLDVQGSPRRLADNVELAAFRIVQEATRNVLHHAHAHDVRVTLGYTRDGLQVSVSDDGCGFDAGAVLAQPGAHLGLLGMRERAAALGGSLTVSSQPAQGTQVRAELPTTAPP